MFKLFKSANTIVKEIHEKIDTAQERLLNEANVIINKGNEYSNSKVHRLKSIGFVNVDSVVDYDKKQDTIVENKEQAQLIRYYQQNYPFQKFITEKELNKICKKYGLIHAPIANYKKDVPEKNISEIENTKPLDYEHQPEDKEKTKVHLEKFLFGGNEFLGRFSKWQRILPSEVDGYYNTHSLDSHFNDIYHTGVKWLVRSVENIRINKQGLFIAAPKSHFDTKGLTNISEFGLASFTIIEPKDPIVFRYCKGGIQVIAK